MGAVVSRRILQAWGSPSIPNHDLSQGSVIARQVSSVDSDKVAQDDATAQRSLFIEEIAPFIDIIDLIFDVCTLRSLLQLSKTCRLAHRVVHEWISTTWSNRLHYILSQYFEDPRAFRSLQARTGTLIAGSTALSFFTRRSFGTESDLDIYVYMPHCGEVGNWLLEAGYVFQHRRNEPTFEQMIADPASMLRREVDNYTIPGVARVLTFIRSVSDSDTQRQVHVIVALDNPLSVILGSHSTCVMNVIDYEKAYCLFARATIIERSTIFSASCLGLNRRRIEGQRKYAKRGYSTISCLTPITMNLLNPGELHLVECGKRFFFKNARLEPADRIAATGIRYPGDGASWEIPLTMDGIILPPSATTSSAPRSYSPLAACSWLVCYRTWCSTAVEMVFDGIKGHVLQHPYLVPGRDSELLSWMRDKEDGVDQTAEQPENLEGVAFYDEEFMTLLQSAQMRSAARWLDADILSR